MKSNTYVKKRGRAFKLVLFTFAGAITLILLTGLTYYLAILPDMTTLEESRLTVANSAAFIFFGDDGKPLNEVSPLRDLRKTEINTLNENTKNAFIAVEDKRFYDHNGIDTVRIGGALASNIKAGSLKEGASTITQQLIKNTFLSNEKSLKRKLNEIMLSRELEKRFTKEQILEMYLNTIYFGNNAYGIEAASRVYFNKGADKLTLAESALLAGIIKAPNKYSPTSDPSACLNRRNLVIKNMFNQNMISKSEYLTCIDMPIDLNVINKDTFFIKKYMHCAIQETCDLLNIDENRLSRSNLRIYTYCDAEKQRLVEDQITSIKVKTVEGEIPQSCALLVNNQTRGVEAFCGFSRGNLYIQKRQPGSVAKPIAVYAPAVNEGLINAASPVLDEPINFGGYSPRNYMNKHYGWITVRSAVARSINSTSVKILNDLGCEKSCEYLKKNGIETGDESLTMALGGMSKGATIQGLNDAYTTFATGGNYSKSAFVKKIIDAHGNLLYEHKPKERQVFSPETSYIMTNMLFSVINNGTGRELHGFPFEIAAKSGTSGARDGDNSDAFFTSYTTLHTLTVWLGSNGAGLPAGVSGGTVPAKISREIYSTIYKNVRPHDFAVPVGVKQYKVDSILLTKDNKIELANDFIPAEETLIEFFADSNSPKTVSTRNSVPERVKFILRIFENTPQIVFENFTKDMIYEIHRIKNNSDTIIYNGSVDQNIFIDKNAGIGVLEYYVVPTHAKSKIRGEKSDHKSIFIDTKPAPLPSLTDKGTPWIPESVKTEKTPKPPKAKGNSFGERIRRLLGGKS